MMMSYGMRVMFLISVIALFKLAERVLLGVAAYNDARSKSNQDAVMWGLLIGFLGLIPGIIYLCIRNKAHVYTVCTNCGFGHPVTDANCPKCGAPNQLAAQYANPFAAAQAHRAKILFIIAMILLAFILIVAIVIGIQIASAMFFTTNFKFHY